MILTTRNPEKKPTFRGLFYICTPKFNSMSNRFIPLVLAGILTLCNNKEGFAQEKKDTIGISTQELKKLLDNSNVSTQIFLGYRYYEEGKDNFNEFAVKRGYITFKKSINKYISGRITPDITIDKEGDGMGDVEMRLKYCYMEFKSSSWEIFTEPSVLFGEVFTPWLEFEEKINEYRVQGAHYLDRVGATSSADFGVIATSLLGGKMDETYQKEVSKGYPGRYGSVAFGIFNGGGYHAIEQNSNKTIQWRLTLRPLPGQIPGLQLSYTGAHGKGNTNLNPNWDMHSAVVSFEHRYFNLTAQILKAKGDFEGIMADANGNSYSNGGHSLFGEIKMFNEKVSLFGRYDYHSVDKVSNTVNTKRFIGGLAYHIYGRNKIVIDFDHQMVTGKDDVGIVEFVVELAL